MNTTKPAGVSRRRALAAMAVALILVMAWTAESLIAASLAEAPRSVRTTGHDSAGPDGLMREAVAGKGGVPTAREPGAERKVDAYQGHGVPGAMRMASASPQQHASQSHRQLAAMQAGSANPGPGGPANPQAASPGSANGRLALTLGDVLFTSGRADLNPVAKGSLNELVTFLAQYRDRSIAIQGYTDSLGKEERNQELSERRANSVKAYLVSQGIDSTRLFAAGMGQSNPVAGNDSRAGRQHNRRAELIIKDPPAAVPQRPRATKMIVLLMLLQSVSGRSGRPFL